VVKTRGYREKEAKPYQSRTKAVHNPYLSRIQPVRMITKQNPICIFPKDVQRVTGKSERYARMLLKKIKEQLGKQKHQLVTIEEFCNYIGVKPEQVMALLTQ